MQLTKCKAVTSWGFFTTNLSTILVMERVSNTLLIVGFQKISIPFCLFVFFFWGGVTPPPSKSLPLVLESLLPHRISADLLWSRYVFQNHTFAKSDVTFESSWNVKVFISSIKRMSTYIHVSLFVLYYFNRERHCSKELTTTNNI